MFISSTLSVSVQWRSCFHSSCCWSEPQAFDKYFAFWSLENVPESAFRIVPSDLRHCPTHEHFMILRPTENSWSQSLSFIHHILFHKWVRTHIRTTLRTLISDRVPLYSAMAVSNASCNRNVYRLSWAASSVTTANSHEVVQQINHTTNMRTTAASQPQTRQVCGHKLRRNRSMPHQKPWTNLAPIVFFAVLPLLSFNVFVWPYVWPHLGSLFWPVPFQVGIRGTDDVSAGSPQAQ